MAINLHLQYEINSVQKYGDGYLANWNALKLADLPALDKSDNKDYKWTGTLVFIFSYLVF